MNKDGVSDYAKGERELERKGDRGTEEGEAMWETRETRGVETRRGNEGKVTVKYRRGGKRNQEGEDADKVR